MEESKNLESHPIVFFDGVCNLCNHSIDFLIKRDHKKKLRYASLQGNTAQALLGQKRSEGLDSVYFYQAGKISKRSKALILAAYELGGVWKCLTVFLIVPAFIRDFFYQVVARYRYKIFGKRETCRLPSRQEQELFLD